MTGVAYEFQWMDIYLALDLFDIESMLPGRQQVYPELASANGMMTVLAPGVFLPSTLTQEGQFEEVEYVLDYLADLAARNELNFRVAAAPTLKGATSDVVETAEFTSGCRRSTPLIC